MFFVWVTLSEHKWVILAERRGAGHVSKQILKHYSHIRMEAKRRAVDALVKKPAEAQNAVFPNEPAKEIAKVVGLN